MHFYVLVTGASSGIGESICDILIRHGYHVLAGIRTQEDKNRLSLKYGDKIYPLLMDVTDQAQMEAARKEAEIIIGQDSFVGIINNAGIVVNGAVLYIPMKEWHQQFEVNFFGVIRTIQLFFHLLIAKEAGETHPRRIINISSVSGLFASPFMAPYASSKYALEALSDSLRRELYMYNIQVVLIQPGGIQTPIWTKAKDSGSWMGPEYDSILEFKNRIIDNTVARSLPVEVVSKRVLSCIRDRKVRNRYLIKAGAWKFRMIRRLPESWIDKMIRKRLQGKSKIRPF